MATEIKYNGSTIASLETGQTATLECAGKKMTGDIVIAYMGSSSVSLISFTIVGASYQAEDGMTWAEWCGSEYNTEGAQILYDQVYDSGQIGWLVYAEQESDVFGEDVIENGTEYTWKYTGGSND